MGNFGKTHMKVTALLPGRVPVLGGDVLAIPTKAPNKKMAIKLIDQLVAKETQRVLAERLFWAPMREDVYKEIVASQPQFKEYFQEIQKALNGAELRPSTPGWELVIDVLSGALQDVLDQNQNHAQESDTERKIDELLRWHGATLKEIPLTYEACEVVLKKTGRPETCEVEVPTEKSFEELGQEFNTQANILAKVNGRGESDPVSHKNMQFLLVPEKSAPRNEGYNLR
jgi:hypothetical protein